MLNSSIQRAVGNAELLRRLLPVAAVSLQCLFQHLPAQVVKVQALRLFRLYLLGIGVLRRRLPERAALPEAASLHDGRHARRALYHGTVQAGLPKLPLLVYLLAHAREVAAQVGDVATKLIKNLVEYLALALVRVLAGLGDGGKFCRVGVVGDETLEVLRVDFPLLREHRHL